MNLAGEFLGEHGVDHAVTLYAGLAVERRGYHFNAEMAFAGAGRSGMAGVMMGVVDDVERLGREGCVNFSLIEFSTVILRKSLPKYDGWRAACSTGQLIAFVGAEPCLL